MKINDFSVSALVQKILTGRITPFNFLILLGFVASLTLLYICLQIYSSNLSERINSSSKTMRSLRKENIRLTVEYNRLIKPERIIPKALKLGMKRGSSYNINDLTLERNQRLFSGNSFRDNLSDGQLVSNSGIGKE
jgi:cell division protein FtsL